MGSRSGGSAEGQSPMRATGVATSRGLLFAATSPSATDVMLDPQQTRIRFRVDSTLHLVEGSADLLRGEIRFEPEGGSASGEIEVDAESVDTGNLLRDTVLHGKVLDSERYPRITFRPRRVEVDRIVEEGADVRVAGSIEINGTVRPLVVPGRVRLEGERVGFAASFEIPYVEWGMTDPGSFLLRVDHVVTVEIDTAGRISPPLRTLDLHASPR